MFFPVLTFTLFFFFIFIFGLIWVLRLRGKTTKHMYNNLTEPMDANNADPNSSFEKSVFRGIGMEVEASATYSYSEIKKDLRAGQIRKALPPLLVGIGIMGFILSVSFLIYIAAPESDFPLILIGFTLFSVLYILYFFIKAK